MSNTAITYAELRKKFLDDIKFTYTGPENRYDEILNLIKASQDFDIDGYKFVFKKRELTYGSNVIRWIYSMNKPTDSTYTIQEVLVSWIGEENSYGTDELYGYIDAFEFVKPEIIELHKVLDNVDQIPEPLTKNTNSAKLDDIEALKKILISQDVDKTLIDSIRNNILLSTKCTDKIEISNISLSKDKECLKFKAVVDYIDTYNIAYTKRNRRDWETTLEKVYDF